MIIVIDGKPVEEVQVSGENLEEVLVELQEHHVSPERLIGEVILNGRSYSEDLPRASVEVARSDIQSLELVTRSAEEIAMHFIEHGSNIVDSMLASLPRITEMFRLGDESEASEHFLRFLESLHLLVSMVEKAGRAVALRFDLPIGDRESLNERMQKLAGILTQLLSIQEQSDWIYLADVLEYELTPELENLGALLPELKRQAH